MGPALSSVREMGTMPALISAPQAGFKPTMPCSAAQPTMEKLVSVPMATAQNPADTATAEPVLEPPGSHCAPYALCTCPASAL